MSKPIKEVLIGTMQNGKQVLHELEIARKIGTNIETNRGQVRRKIREYHPDYLNLKVIEKEVLDPLATRFRFVCTDESLPVFEAGQYINIFFEVDGVRTSRPYSIASAPHHRGYFDIIVARTKNGFVSDYLLDEVEVNQEFVSTGPMGVFRYQPIHHKHHQVMIAGGSGITPMQSMILDTLEQGKDRQITLFYGVRRLEYATNHDLFTELSKNYPNFNYVLVLSEEENDDYEYGFVSADLIKRHVKDVFEATYFICGPEIMNTFCQNELKAMGIRKAMIRRELFQSRKDIENEPAWPTDISPTDEFTVTLGSLSFKAKANESLLSALEKQDVPVKVGCRSGECSYCRLKLVSGQVFTAQGNLQRHADEAFGYIHSCKTYPISDVTLEL